jgi:hypothetical protein
MIDIIKISEEREYIFSKLAGTVTKIHVISQVIINEH